MKTKLYPKNKNIRRLKLSYKKTLMIVRMMNSIRRVKINMTKMVRDMKMMSKMKTARLGLMIIRICNQMIIMIK